MCKEKSDKDLVEIFGKRKLLHNLYKSQLKDIIEEAIQAFGEHLHKTPEDEDELFEDELYIWADKYVEDNFKLEPDTKTEQNKIDSRSCQHKKQSS